MGVRGDWAALPRPGAPLTLGIDGCYVREWEDKKKNFEVIRRQIDVGRGAGSRFRVCPDI